MHIAGNAPPSIYHTPDGSQGMGAAQLNRFWAIIPACWRCNIAGEKRLNAYCALLLGEEFRALTLEQGEYLERLKVVFAGEDYSSVRRRVAFWAQRLREVKPL